MAFKLPFGKDDRETIEDIKAKGNALLNTAFGLGPLAFASYQSINSMKSNNPNFLASLPTNQMGDIHSKVGETFDRYSVIRSKVREAAKQNAITKFKDVDVFLDKLAAQEAEKKLAFLSNLKTIIADPNVGNDIGELMKQVDGLLEQSFSGELDLTSNQTRESLKNMIGQILDSDRGSSSNRAGKIAGYASSPFYPVSDLLIQPQNISMQAIQPKINAINSGSVNFDKYTQTNVFKMVKAAFGNDASYQIFTRQERVGNITGEIPYVQISNQRGVMQTLPLDLSHFRKQGVVPIRYGNMNTMYAGSGAYVDALELNKIAKMNNVDARRNAVISSLSGKDKTIFMTPEDALAQMYVRDVQSRGGIGRISSMDKSFINQNIQQSLEFIDRFGNTGSSMSSNAIETFLMRKYQQTAHSLKILNPLQLSSSDLKNLRPAMSQVLDLFDFSANLFSPGHFGTSMGDIGIRSNFLNMMYGLVPGTLNSGVLETAAAQFGGRATNRATQPITARYRQMYNREEFLKNKTGDVSNKPKAIAVLDVFQEERGGSKIGGMKNMFGIGEGTANYFGETIVTKAINKPVYDPRQYGGSTSLLFGELQYRSALQGSANSRNLSIGIYKNKDGKFITDFVGEFDVNGKKVKAIDMISDLLKKRGLEKHMSVEANNLIYSDINDFFRLFGAKEDNFGLFLGMIDGRRQVMPRYAGLQGLELGLIEEMDSGGQGLRKYSISGFRDTDNPFMKIFSTLFKGTIEKTTEDTMRSTLTERAGFSTQMANILMSRVGNEFSGIYTTEGAMLKKASMNLAEQIGGSFEVFGLGKKVDFSRDLESAIEARFGSFENFESRGVKDQSQELIEEAVKLAARRYGAAGPLENTLEMQGGTFGYFGKALVLGKDVEGINSEKFESLIRDVHKEMGIIQDDSYEKYMENLKKQIGKGVAIGLTDVEIGPQSSSLGQNMGSMEPRLYNFLSYKLTSEMGLSKDKASQFLFSVLARKQGTAESIELAREYSKTMESFAKRNVFEEDIPRVSVGEFTENFSEKGIRDFLGSQKGGFLLDFSDDKVLQQRLSQAGLPEQIYLPGGMDFLELLEKEKTLIPTDEGLREIDADYIKVLNKLSRDLMEVSTADANAESIQGSLRGIKEFKESMSQFFGMSFRNTLRGKMAGSTFALGGTTDLGRFSDQSIGFRLGHKNEIEELGDSGIFEKTQSGAYRVKKTSEGNFSQKAIDIYSDTASSLDRESFNKYLYHVKESKNMQKNEGYRSEHARAASNVIQDFNLNEDQMRKYLQQSLGSVNYNDSEKYLMRKIQRSTFGHAVFQDSTSFLNAMSSFMKGVNAQYVMENAVKQGTDPKQALKRAKQQSRKALRDSLQYYFLGSYEQSKYNMQNVAILDRHPVMGPGHVEFVQSFRDLSELRGRDGIFEKLVATEGGIRAQQDFENLTGRKVTGFKELLTFVKEGLGKNGTSVYNPTDAHIMRYYEGRNLNKIGQITDSIQDSIDPEEIAEMEKARLELEEKNIKINEAINSGDFSQFEDEIKKARGRLSNRDERIKLTRSYFEALANHMGDVSPGVGGGRLIIPQFMVDVHYGDKSMRLDLSLASGMIGDFDGDIYQLLFPTRSTLGDKGINLLGGAGSQNLKKIAEERLIYRAKTRAIFDLAGAGMDVVAKRLEGGTLNRSLIDENYVKAAQEQIAKNVGPIDVSFDALRLGIVNTATEANRGVASDALNLLAAIQEVAVIKAKKLSTDLPLAEAISKNLNRAIEGDKRAFDIFQDLIVNYVFADQDIGKVFGKAEFTGGGLDVLAGSLEGQRVSPLVAPGGTSSADDALTYVMPYLKQLLGHVKESGYLHAKTERRIALASSGEIRGYNEAMQGLLRETVQGRLMGSDTTETTMDDLELAIKKLTGIMRTNAIEIGSKGRIGGLGVGLAATMALGSSLGYGGYDPTPLAMEGEFVSPELRAAIREGSAFDTNTSQDAIRDMQNSIQSDIMNRQINIGEMLMDNPGGFQVRGQANNMKAVSELSYIMGALGGQSHLTINDTRGPISQNYVRRKYFED